MWVGSVVVPYPFFFNLNKMKNKPSITYHHYDKEYISNSDTYIYSISIKNSFWNIDIKITDGKHFRSIEILSNDITQYYDEFTNDYLIPLEELFQKSEDFLFANELQMYIIGFGLPAYNSLVDLNQSKPSNTNNYESNNNYQDR